MVKLSIIVPVYNAIDYLDNCINSILSSSFSDFELILVNDGSTDKSGNLCDLWMSKDPRVKVLHKPNGGSSSALNVGLNCAKGNYIGFVDQDDFIAPLMFEKMMDSAARNDADIVICRCQYILKDGTVVKIQGYDTEMAMDRVAATKEILRDEIILSFSWDKIYKRELWENIRFPLGRIYDDTPTIYKLFWKSDKVCTIPYIGYNYLQNPNSVTNSKHTDVQKYVTRDLHNALAFHERYLFAKSEKELEDIVSLCAYKSYTMTRCFVHMLGHKKIDLTKEQETIVDGMLSSFDIHDLNAVSLWEKLDLYLYRTSKSLLMIYIKTIPYFKKMKEA